MSDVKDILGVPRDGTPAQSAPAPKKEKLKRPEGMSREAFALLSGGLNPLAPTALAEQLKKKDFKQLAKSKRTSSKGIVTYQWMPFSNPGRTDGLQLSHWVKCYKDRANVITPANKGEYPFAKYNVKAPVSRYNDEEWSNLIAADPEWTREETDYLLDLCEALALKFFVIADRYNYKGKERSVDEIKARYYAIARQLLIGREGGSQQVANHTLVKHPFNLQYELNRKKGMDLVMANRDITVDETEMQLLQQADKIEAAKRAEAAKLRPAAAPGSAGGKGVGGAPTPSQAIELDYTEVAPAPGGVCSLFDANLKPFQPPKAGVYLRGAHTLATGQAQLEKLPAAVRSQKHVEATLQELRVSPDLLPMPTRTVSAAWLSLRNEVIQYVDLERQLAVKQGGDGGALARKRSKFVRQ